MTATSVEAWKERAYVSIVPQPTPDGAGGGSFIAFGGFSEDIVALDWGKKDVEGLPLLNGGRITKFSPMGDELVTFKVYPLSALLDDGSDNAEGADQWFNPQSSEDDTEPIVADNTIDRRKFKIVILWAATLPANAQTLPAAGVTARRVQIINAYLAEYPEDFGDKLLTQQLTFKWAPFDKSASANKRVESTTGVSQLSAVTTATASF